MTGFWIVAVIAALCWVFFAFAGVELAVLLGRRAAVPTPLQRLVPGAVDATGVPRIVGTVFSVVVAIGTQLLAGYLVLGRNSELNVAELAVLVVELAAAALWTMFLARRLSLPPDEHKNEVTRSRRTQ